MKSFFLITFLSTAIIAHVSAQINLKKYTKIPDSLHWRGNLAKYITPDKNYTYWELGVNEWDTTRPVRMIFSTGRRPENLIIKSPPVAFSDGFLPAGFITYYVAYVIDGKVGFITSTDQLITFIGRIDNVQEALLLIMLREDLSFDDKKIGGSYRNTQWLRFADDEIQTVPRNQTGHTSYCRACRDS